MKVLYEPNPETKERLVTYFTVIEGLPDVFWEDGVDSAGKRTYVHQDNGDYIFCPHEARLSFEDSVGLPEEPVYIATHKRKANGKIRIIWLDHYVDRKMPLKNPGK